LSANVEHLMKQIKTQTETRAEKIIMLEKKKDKNAKKKSHCWRKEDLSQA